VKDDSKHKNAWQPDYIAIDRQLVNMAVPNHGQNYTKVPESTDEKKTTKKVVIFFSTPRQDKKQHCTIQEKPNAGCYGGNQDGGGHQTLLLGSALQPTTLAHCNNSCVHVNHLGVYCQHYIDAARMNSWQ
jgi:hypothetical protein